MVVATAGLVVDDRIHFLFENDNGDRTYKLGSDTTSGYGRYVKPLGEPVTGLNGLGAGDLVISYQGSKRGCIQIGIFFRFHESP